MKFNPDLIDFFKKHNLYNKEMFDYFEKHSMMIDTDYTEYKMFLTCAYSINKKTGVLEGLFLNMPYVKDENTMLDSIHELTHAIFTYPQIGKKYKRDITVESLSLLYEKLYIAENPTPKLLAYSSYLDSLIAKDDKEYDYGLKVRDELYKSYDYNPKKMLKMTKKLSRKYRKNYK